MRGLLIRWVVNAIALYVTAQLVGGVSVDGTEAILLGRGAPWDRQRGDSSRAAHPHSAFEHPHAGTVHIRNQRIHALAGVAARLGFRGGGRRGGDTGRRRALDCQWLDQHSGAGLISEVAGTIRLVALDLDGTVVGDDLVILPRVKDAVREAMARGVRVILVTGRMFRSALPFARELGIKGPFIAYNGALVMDAEGTVHLSDPVPRPLVLEIVDLAAKEGVTP